MRTKFVIQIKRVLSQTFRRNFEPILCDSKINIDKKNIYKLPAFCVNHFVYQFRVQSMRVDVQSLLFPFYFSFINTQSIQFQSDLSIYDDFFYLSEICCFFFFNLIVFFILFLFHRHHNHRRLSPNPLRKKN